MEEVYGREWYLGKRRRFVECKRVGKRVWRKVRGRSKETGGDKRKMKSKVESRGRWVQKKWITKKVYGEDFV